jgi:hypothetical protein
MMYLRPRLLATVLIVSALALLPAVAQASSLSFIGRFHEVTKIGSTVPANDDVNPYGTAVVPRSVGRLVSGHILVSNFNNRDNFQGTGTTIAQVSPDGDVDLFARITPSSLPAGASCPGGIGLTTALVVLRDGFVIVGSLPTIHQGSTFAGPGCLIVLNSRGRVVGTVANDRLNGPWDMTAVDVGDDPVLFVTTVLNGLDGIGTRQEGGTVLRIELDLDRTVHVRSETIIGSGFANRTDPSALVVGPTGVGLGCDGTLYAALPCDGTLYIADTANSAIRGIRNALFRSGSAGTGLLVSQGGHLNGPLGLAIAPNGDILTVNAGDDHLVETTPGGTQIDTRTLLTAGVNAAGSGDLFGLAIAPCGTGVYFVNDFNNALYRLH